MKNDKILEKIISIIKEDMPTMAMGHGKIAGSVEAGDNPPIKRRKKYIKMAQGSRKIWLDYLKNKKPKES